MAEENDRLNGIDRCWEGGGGEIVSSRGEQLIESYRWREGL